MSKLQTLRCGFKMLVLNPAKRYENLKIVLLRPVARTAKALLDRTMQTAFIFVNLFSIPSFFWSEYRTLRQHDLQATSAEVQKLLRSLVSPRKHFSGSTMACNVAFTHDRRNFHTKHWTTIPLAKAGNMVAKWRGCQRIVGSIVNFIHARRGRQLHD